MSQTDTRTEILNLARSYLQKLGFNAFSFQTIADQLGIRKASIHYHFKSKEEMGVALLDEFITGFRDWVERRRAKNVSALRNLEAYFRIYEVFGEDRTKICPLGVLSADWNTLPDAMRERIRLFHGEQRAWLIETLKAGRDAGELTLESTPEVSADLMLSALQGALQIARVRDDLEPLANTRKFIVRRLKGE